MYRHLFQLIRRFVISVVLILLASTVLLPCQAYSESAGAAGPERPDIAKEGDRDIHSIIPLQRELNTRSDWYAVAYEGESMLGKSKTEVTARLCFRKGRNGKDENCFLAQICCLSAGEPYECWAVQDLKVIPFFKRSHPSRVLLFRAEFSAFGSDSLDLITLWSYDRKVDRFIQITPTDKSKAIALNSQDVFRLIDFDDQSNRKILAVSHFIWGEDEGHFEPHFYRISIYVFHPRKGFVLLGKYRTKKKYPGLDDAALPLDFVIDGELRNIKKFARQKLK